MPRKPRKAEFLEVLWELSGHENVSAFAKACGKHTFYMTDSGHNRYVLITFGHESARR